MVSFILLKKFLFYVKVIVNLIDWLFFDLCVSNDFLLKKKKYL